MQTRARETSRVPSVSEGVLVCRRVREARPSPPARLGLRRGGAGQAGPRDGRAPAPTRHPGSERRSVVPPRPHGLHSPWDSPGQDTGVGSRSLLQGILPAQGSNPALPHCGRILYQLSYQGSPRIRTGVRSIKETRPNGLSGDLRGSM